jgi:hypothetical protein
MESRSRYCRVSSIRRSQATASRPNLYRKLQPSHLSRPSDKGRRGELEDEHAKHRSTKPCYRRRRWRPGVNEPGRRSSYFQRYLQLQIKPRSPSTRSDYSGSYSLLHCHELRISVRGLKAIQGFLLNEMLRDSSCTCQGYLQRRTLQNVFSLTRLDATPPATLANQPFSNSGPRAMREDSKTPFCLCPFPVLEHSQTRHTLLAPSCCLSHLPSLYHCRWSPMSELKCFVFTAFMTLSLMCMIGLKLPRKEGGYL